jgi:hypothetical protein
MQKITNLERTNYSRFIHLPYLKKRQEIMLESTQMMTYSYKYNSEIKKIDKLKLLCIFLEEQSKQIRFLDP